MFQRHEVVESVPDVSVFGMNALLQKYTGEVDFIVADTEAIVSRLHFHDGYVAIPKWVNFRFHLRPTWEETTAQFRKGLRKDLNKLVRKGFEPSPSFDKTELAYFYHQMYLPHATKRFDDYALLLGEDTIVDSDGFLLHLNQDGSRLMSSFLRPSKGALVMAAWGMEDTKELSDARGAFTAAAYYAIEYAQKNGYRCVDFLSSKPTFADGSFFFKRKWGSVMSAVPDSSGDFRLRTCRLSPAARSFWHNNPVVIRRKDKLHGLAFIDGMPAGEDEIGRLTKLWLTEGMQSLIIMSPAGFHQGAIDHSEADERIELVDLGKPGCPREVFGIAAAETVVPR
jgi:hypothetical protein